MSRRAEPRPPAARSATMRRAAGVVAAAVLAITGCTAPTAGPTAPSWTSVWRDDFTGPAGARLSDQWRHDLGTCYPGCPAPRWGTGEIETMTDDPANVSLDGAGRLAITPRRVAGQWTSARVETARADFQPPAGGVLRVEAALRLPDVSTADGAGYWPAFWMLGAPFRDGHTDWPGAGEIDVMESVNGRPAVVGAMHCGELPDGPCREARGGLGSPERACGDCGRRFHVYAAELDLSTSPARVRWYLDGVMFHQVTAAEVGEPAWSRATAHGFFVILNVAVGGAFPAALGGGPTTATVPGRPMLVDYVAVSVRRPA
ncbi:glycoside hydrolase family 16 protein [Krasilnikovia sp. MM14-A1004]|uniref:glycoside hydrolase family 16 protein n=1 Tax=Krasilnikovia sp. MM14-A1004 TaxID=3373541 RepID=UPI00399D4F1D